jgi:hypothetical protein
MELRSQILGYINISFAFMTGSAGLIDKFIESLPNLAIGIPLLITVIIFFVNLKLKKKKNKLLDLQIKNEELLLRKKKELGLKD